MSRLTEFFCCCWDDREDDAGAVYCFETGQRMSRGRYRLNSAVYSHILPKETFPEYKFEKWNVKIVLPEAHHQFSINPEKAPKQYKLYLEFLEKYKK